LEIRADPHRVRFLTWYDYETRFGPLGRALDRCLFRPLLGWATAWSFDRLRLWIERGIPPEESRDRMLAYSIARATVAFTWFYHGLFPKLLRHDAVELDLVGRIGTPASRLMTAVTAAGLGEILFALMLLMLWRQKWPLWVTLVLMLVGIPVVAVSAPAYLGAAFNPVTLNLGLAALSAIGLIAARDLPTAHVAEEGRRSREIHLRTRARRQIPTLASADPGAFRIQQQGPTRICWNGRNGEGMARQVFHSAFSIHRKLAQDHVSGAWRGYSLHGPELCLP